VGTGLPRVAFYISALHKLLQVERASCLGELGRSCGVCGFPGILKVYVVILKALRSLVLKKLFLLDLTFLKLT
jgi:hypothetical protein